MRKDTSPPWRIACLAHTVLGWFIMAMVVVMVFLVVTLSFAIWNPARAEPSREIEVLAFCEDVVSIEAMRGVLIKADRLDRNEGWGAGDRLYYDFIVNDGDEFNCRDTDIQGLRPFRAIKVAPVLESAMQRNCHEIVFWEVFVSGRTVYTWRLDRFECA